MYQRIALCGTSRYARLCVTKLDIDKSWGRELNFCSARTCQGTRLGRDIPQCRALMHFTRVRVDQVLSVGLFSYIYSHRIDCWKEM